MTRFRFLTSGESHGKCLSAIIEGIVAGIFIDIDFINSELSSRQGGLGRGKRMEIERDRVKIKSGVRFGYTTGAPICIEIENIDFKNWEVSMSTFKPESTYENEMEIDSKRITKVRPGHADFAGVLKYRLSDVRDVLERSSARNTAIMCAVGAIAQIVLKKFSIECSHKVLQIGRLSILEDTTEEDIIGQIEDAKELGTTLGGKIEVQIRNVPIGLGSYVHWDRRLDGKIAQAVMSIQGVKAVEIGSGVECASMMGFECQDEIFCSEGGEYYRKTNNAGGIEGGMSNGESIVVKATMKPIPTMRKPLKSVDIFTREAHLGHFERSDVCAVNACGVVVKNMVAIVILSEFLEKFGSDSLVEMEKNFNNYKENIYEI